MAAPQQSGNQPESSGFLWIVGAILAGGGIIWFSFKKQIVAAYFTFKLWEINLISLFTHRLDDVQSYILNANPGSLTFSDVVKVGQAVGDYLRIPFVIILFILSIIVYFANSTREFKRVYSMKDLAELEKANWPQITPVLKLDLAKTDIDKGPWAMALTPMQFCKRHKLIEEYRRQRQEGMSRKEWNRVEANLKRGLATKIFALQLGPLLKSVDALPLHVKALFAVFAARYNNDTKAAAKLLADISVSSDTKLNFAGVDELFNKHKDTKGVKKIINSHGYVLTLMASMLEAAREDGVQASADFLWLKPVDRRMWYMLNTVGRQTPFVEVAGPFAHWVAEKEFGKKLIVPMVEEATNALELALKEIVYQPDDDSVEG